MNDQLDETHEESEDESAGSQSSARFWAAFADVLPTLATPRSIWETALARSYRGYFKATDADAIMHVCDGNQIRHEPVEWSHERERWEHVDDENVYWNAAAEGRNEYRATDKQIPSVWAAAESHEVGSHVQAEVAQALDLGAERELWTDATVAHFDPRMIEEEGAVTDGGARYQDRISVEEPGEFVDELVPIGSGAHGDRGASGAVVSMRKYQEVYPSTPGAEELKQQEIRGRLAEQENEEDLVKTALLYAGLIIIGALAAVEVLPLLLSSDGGAAGGLLGLLPLLMPQPEES